MNRNATDMLERRLREEAKALREKDGFSSILHERIMFGLRQRSLAGTPVRIDRARSAWRIVGWVAAAAAVVVLMAWVIIKSGSPDSPPPRPVVQLPAPQPSINTVSLDSASSALNERKYAYLDRDANRLLSFVANQLPELPAANHDAPRK